MVMGVGTMSDSPGLRIMCRLFTSSVGFFKCPNIKRKKNTSLAKSANVIQAFVLLGYKTSNKYEVPRRMNRQNRLLKTNLTSAILFVY